MNDNSGLTLDVKKQFSSAGQDNSTEASFISPLYVTDKIKENASDIIRNLTNEGII